MKEHPILFSAPVIRAILDGRKTQTRRLVKPQPNQTEHGWEWAGTRPKAKRGSGAIATVGADPLPAFLKNLAFSCPYGKIGDRLWVREAWAIVCHSEDRQCYGEECLECVYEYRADKPDEKLADGWNPSIFMPRKASRILLEITEVRVERLCEISPNTVPGDGDGENSWVKNSFVWVITFTRL